MGGGGERDRVGFGETLRPGRDVHHVAEGERVAPVAAAHRLDDHLAGVDPDPHREAPGVLVVDRRDLIEQREPRVDGQLGCTLVRLRVAEVHDESVPEVLGDVTVEAADGSVTGRLVLAHQLPEVLGVEVGRERDRIDQIAEEDRDLAPLACLCAARERSRAARRTNRRTGHRPGSRVRTPHTSSCCPLPCRAARP